MRPLFARLISIVELLLVLAHKFVADLVVDKDDAALVTAEKVVVH